MSAFGSHLAQESADNENQNVPAAIPEDETATSEIADATAEHTEVAQEDDIAEQLGEEQEQVEDLAETVAQESAGLSPAAARLLNTCLKRIVGAKRATKIVATENYSTSRSAQEDAKQIALEGIKETLKQFWEAIKAQLKKFYDKARSFFTKVFSAARKLKERAENLQKKASDTTGTMQDKSFSFSQTKAIAVDGKFNDAGVLTTGLNNIRKWVVANLTVQKAEKYETIVESASQAIEKAVKSAIKNRDNSRAGIAAGLHAGKIVVELGQAGGIAVGPLSTQSSPDKKLIDMYTSDASVDSVSVSQPLPGGKAIITVLPSENAEPTIENISKCIKNARLVLGNDKATQRDVAEGEVKTLTTGQIDKVCDDVIEIAESSYTYEKAFAAREKFQSKLEREVDAVIKEVNTDDELDSRTQRVVRAYAESFTASVRRRTSFESTFIGYALNTASAMLNYSERSLAQHKAA